ncbi:hypothetical protein ZIOFF_013793 [Zingiber officinale]|uniref:beta-galactosidase n=1 Tax=Zingiber officinale TaxID=94328 RepID=A0A8J5LUF6_ZINOF|nr:hypothetical protein ZIOFF_013793 [Zingiber officinale]
MAIVINGQRKILISGSIHYRRSTLEMWEGLVEKAKDEDLDYNFEGGLVKMSLESASEQTMNLSRSKSKAFGIVGHAYLNWAAQMVVGLGTGVPWVMCKEDDAPDPVNRFIHWNLEVG